MKKYTRLFATYFASSIAYRADLLSTVFLEAISVSSVVILWTAIFRTQHMVASYSFGQTVSYYLAVPVIGFMTQVVVSDRLSREIRTGAFSNYLLRPLTFWRASLTGVLATKLNYLVLVSPIIAGVFLYLHLSGAVRLSLASLLSALLIAVLAFIFHFVLDLSIAFGAFWLDDVWAFAHIKNILFSVLGGLSFPLDFVTGPLKSMLSFLPFQYLYYVPVSYLLGRRAGIDILAEDAVKLLAWTMAAACLAALLWRFGVRKYGAYGR